MSRSQITVFLMALLALAGCGSLLEADRAPQQTWWLEPLTTPAGPETASDIRLTVNVTAVPGLDTDRILNINDESRLNHYEGARWPDHAPDVLASLLVRSIEASGRFQQVTVRHSRPTKGCHLDLELRRFFARLEAGGQARRVAIELAGGLDCGDGPQPVSASATIPLDSASMPSIVAGFQTALDHSTQALLSQLTPTD